MTVDHGGGCSDRMYILIHKFIFFGFFCYYAKYGRVRGPGIPGKIPKNSRMKVCSRDTNKFFWLLFWDFVVNIYNYYFCVKLWGFWIN